MLSLGLAGTTLTAEEPCFNPQTLTCLGMQMQIHFSLKIFEITFACKLTYTELQPFISPGKSVFSEY